MDGMNFTVRMFDKLTSQQSPRGDQEGTTSVPDPVCGLTLWLEEVINGDHQVELELSQVLISRVSLTLVTRTHTQTHAQFIQLEAITLS